MDTQSEYSEGDIQEILKRAAAIDGSADPSRRLLEQTAAEIGISPDALAQAEREYLAEKEAKSLESEFYAHRSTTFYRHLATYLVINAFLVGIWWLTGSRYPWFIWPLLGWGLAILLQAMHLATRSGSEYERELEEWRAKRENGRNPKG